MAKKAKWLEESTNQELLGEVLEKLLLGEDIEKKDINRAIKAVEELMERLPNEDESEISVEEALELLRGEFEKHISLVETAYQAELDAMDEEDDYEDDYEDEEDFDEDFEDEEDFDEDEEEDYSDWTVKELRAECRKRGISTKGLKKADMLELLLDEDEEDFEDEEDDYEDFDEDFEDEEDFEEDEEDEIEYSELSNKALKDLCRERGIKVRRGMKKADFIRALEADDEE